MHFYASLCIFCVEKRGFSTFDSIFYLPSTLFGHFSHCKRISYPLSAWIFVKFTKSALCFLYKLYKSPFSFSVA